MKSAISVLAIASVILGVLCTSRTSTPAGCLTVRASGAASGEYSSLSSAVSALGTGNSSSTACIFLYSGTYSEQVAIKNYQGALTIYGYTTDTTSYANNKAIITHSESAAVAGNDEGSSTLDITVKNLKMYNVNVINSYGKGSQAVALTTKGNQNSFYGCAFYGYQGKGSVIDCETHRHNH
jgi:pectinesterase